MQRLDERNTLLVFMEGKDIEKLFTTLQSIEMSLGCSINPGCDVATPKQMVMGIDYVGWGEKSVSVEGANMQLPRPML